MTQHQVVIEISGPEEDRRPEGVEQGEPKGRPIRTKNPAQDEKHRYDAQRRYRCHAERLHDEGSQAELDVVAASPGFSIKRARHGPGGIVSRGFSQPGFRPLLVRPLNQPIDQRPG